MQYIVATAIVAALIIWAVIANKGRQREKQALIKAHIFSEARYFVTVIEHSHALPIVPTNIILKSGESAFYSAPSILYETRAVRNYQSGYAGFRVAKGVYIGGSSGRSVSSQEWSKIDSGRLTITNKRLIFDGGAADRTVPLNKILSAESGISFVEIFVEGRQKSMVFDAANPLIVATIIRICCQASNPLDLSQTKLDITFVE